MTRNDQIRMTNDQVSRHWTLASGTWTFTVGDLLMVGGLPLKQEVKVRVLLPEPFRRHPCLPNARSSNGRM